MYIWAEGARYEGEYKEHKKHGRGLQTWPTGGRWGQLGDSLGFLERQSIQFFGGGMMLLEDFLALKAEL